MAYWDALGRSLSAQATQEDANRIADFFQDMGLDTTVSSDPKDGLFDVLVLQGQEKEAARLLAHFRRQEAERQARAAAYRADCLEASPHFVPSEEKFRTSTNSSFLFIISGLIIIILALLHFFILIYHRQTSEVSASLIELIFGFFFILFGINTHQKVRILKDRILEENAFTDQVVRWYTSTYSAEHMDKCIDAASASPDATDEERFFLRRQLMRDYILREYDISDPAYLDYLTDLIYKRLYFPNGVSTAG